MFFNILNQATDIVSKAHALPGRTEPMSVTEPHFVNGRSLEPPFPEGYERAMFGLGCFWGAERLFWEVSGVYVTVAGYAAGHTPNPTYDEVCSGYTGHNEVVLVVFDPKEVCYGSLLKVFWEGHDPTQGMRQGNDVGTQYRSGVYYFDKGQQNIAKNSLALYEETLKAVGFGEITTEILHAPEFYYAETYHQQYLGRNPSGYCGLGGVGMKFEDTLI
ncbi:MAG: peptide-methionine (S)-S-oxide reductase [Magnetovibrio sp.]|nr:peptide-methionine (S)-S-oxide reductase [Magnetovibrio sp.]